jgi:transketolase
MLDAAHHQQLTDLAWRIRRTLLQMHFGAKSGHIGTGLSTIEILSTLYGAWLPPEGKFILSKGHGASALYATLFEVGQLSDEVLQTYYKDNTLLPAHPAPNAYPSIHVATGSLGHGLPVAVGLALAYRRLQEKSTPVVCMLSDGECNEGSIWEASMVAAHHKLDNLTVIVDANRLQGFGTTAEVLDIAPLAQKWEAFHFDVADVPGHDIHALHAALCRPSDRPRCLIAHTVKGKGVRFMENELAWHYKTLSAEDHRMALQGLGERPGAR